MVDTIRKPFHKELRRSPRSFLKEHKPRNACRSFVIPRTILAHHYKTVSLTPLMLVVILRREEHDAAVLCARLEQHIEWRNRHRIGIDVEHDIAVRKS